MSNSIETIELAEGTVSFDHATLTMSAKWKNGFSETWPRNGYSYEAKYASFLFFTGQMEKYKAFVNEN